MPDSIKRRDFLKAASLAGVSLAVANTSSAGDFLPGDSRNEIMNSFFVVSFSKKDKTVQVSGKNGETVLTGASTYANLADGTRRSPATQTYKYKTETSVFGDRLGKGTRLVIHARDRNRQLDFETRVSLYDDHKMVCFETICRNVSKNNLELHSIEPLRAISSEGGLLKVPDVSKVITNGEMYFDTGRVHEFDKDKKEVSTDSIKGVKLASRSVSPTSETTHSWWNAGLFSGYDKQGIVIGYLENTHCLGNVLVARTAPGEVSFLTESVFAPSISLPPGKSATSNRVIINMADDPYTALENYAGLVGKFNNARTRSVINGWCSWFYTLSWVSEKEVIKNTEFAAKHLKPYGLEYIQVDEGFQKWHGDWDANDRFPHGMKWLANGIKKHGFKAGIWIAPYVISEPTEVFRRHPEWLLKRKDGSLKRVGNWPENAEPPADENPKRYGLDITHPGAAQWLHELIDRIANDWGYEMIKIDFVAWSLLAAEQYYDPTVSSAEAYRRGMEIMRKAAGDKCHILECGPGATTVGLIDSMRIELDINYGFSDIAWNTYFNDPASSMSAAGKRYYFHKRTWVNDADHLCLNLLNNRQSEAAASIIALSGGNMMSGDRLVQLEPNKLDILKKITPSYGEAAKPVDLFDGDDHSVFALKIKKPFAEWTIAGFFNAGLKDPIQKKFPLSRLWLDPGKTWLAYDFWQQKFLGEITGEIEMEIAPASVRLIALHEKTGHPQLISTDRHVLQGAVEIGDISWDASSGTISGAAAGPMSTWYNIYIYIPTGHEWTWSGSALYRDFDQYSLKLVDKNIIQVQVRFDQQEKVDWKIRMDDFNE